MQPYPNYYITIYILFILMYVQFKNININLFCRFISKLPSFLDEIDKELLIQLINDDNLNASYEKDVCILFFKQINVILHRRHLWYEVAVTTIYNNLGL